MEQSKVVFAIWKIFSSGFCMSFSSMMWIPGYAIYYMATSTGSLHDVRSKKEEKKKSPCGGEMPHLLMSKPNMATKKLQSNKGAGKAAQHSYYNYCFNLTNWPIYTLSNSTNIVFLSTFFYSSFLPSPEHTQQTLKDCPLNMWKFTSLFRIVHSLYKMC